MIFEREGGPRPPASLWIRPWYTLVGPFHVHGGSKQFTYMCTLLRKLSLILVIFISIKYKDIQTAVNCNLYTLKSQKCDLLFLEIISNSKFIWGTLDSENMTYS